MDFLLPVFTLRKFWKSRLKTYLGVNSSKTTPYQGFKIKTVIKMQSQQPDVHYDVIVRDPIISMGALKLLIGTLYVININL